MQAKIMKLVNDPCFGSRYEQHEMCPSCWLKNSCLITFRNRKEPTPATGLLHQ